VMGIAFTLLGIYGTRIQSRWAMAFWVVCVCFISLAFIHPTAMKPLHKIWMTIAIIIGSIVSKVVLSAFFYLVITPTGVIQRLLKKSLLDNTFDRSKKSYWIDKKPIDPANYDKQF